MQKSFILNDWIINYNNISYKKEITCLNKDNEISPDEQKAIFQTDLKKFNYIFNSPVIYIPSMGYNFKLYVDDQIVYIYDPVNFDGFPSHLIPIPKFSKNIKIETHVNNYTKGICENIKYSDAINIQKEVITNDYNSIIVISLGIFISLISLLFFILYSKFKQLLFLSFMSLIISVWSFSNKSNQVKQLIYDNSKFWGYLDLISLFLIPTAVFLFFKSLIGIKLKFAYVVSSVFLIFTIYSILYSFINNSSISNFIVYYNYLLVISGVYLIYTLYISFLTRKITIILSVFIALIFGVKDWLVGAGILPWEKHSTRYAFLLFIIIVSFDVYSIIKIFIKNALTSQLKINAINEAMSAIAHEIRRPFSIIDGFFPVIKKLILSKKHETSLDIIINPLQNSLKVVDNIIYDIIDIGTNVILKKDYCDLNEVIYDSMLELYNNFCNSNVKFKFNINLQGKVYIDKFKIKRVFINLISNAIEAMKPEGIVSISANLNQNNLLITVHNTNSSISENLYQQIFEPYYTFNKTNGTGIGLSLCKKFIEAHNGKIEVKSGSDWCQFEIIIKLDFYNLDFKSNIDLVFIDSFKKISENKAYSKIENNYQYYYYISLLKKKIKIVLVDDEFIYYQCLCEILTSNKLDSIVEIEYFDDIDSFLLSDNDFQKYNAYIFDLDFGHKKISGIDFLSKKNINVSSEKIAVSSNRITKDIDNKLSQLGIINIFRKPYSIQTLSEFIFKSIENKPDFHSFVVLIDDEDYVANMWKDKLLDAKLLSFSHPEYFIEECIDKNNIIKNISIIIVDYYFDKFGYSVKSDFINLLKNEGFEGLIILSSNTIIKDEEIIKNFDFIIKKKAYSFKELVEILYLKDNN